MTTETVPPATQPLNRTTQVGEHTIHYRVRDDRAPYGVPPVVLLHGYIASSTYLEPTLRHLAVHHPTYAPDLPGHGDSSDVDHALNIQQTAQVIMDWIRTMGLENVILIGNSLGCATATTAALLDPERVERLVLQGPAMEPQRRDRIQTALHGLRHMGQTAGSGFDTIMWKDYLHNGLKHSLEAWQHALNDRMEHRLPRIHVPTLVVHGEHDPLVSPEWAREAARLLPDGRLTEVAGADHIMVYNQPKTFTGIVVPFLRDGGHNLSVR